MQWEVWALSHPGHTCELLGGAEAAAAVPFEGAVQQQVCHSPLSGGTKAHSCCPCPDWLCQVPAGCAGQLGDALSPGMPAWGRAAVPSTGSC